MSVERPTPMEEGSLIGSVAVLRPLQRHDAETVVRWRNQPHVVDQMFFAPPTIDEHLRWFDALSGNSNRLEFVISRRDASASPVGTIGLSSIDMRHNRAEYGILIGEPSALGGGLAADASRLLLSHAFHTLRLHRVFLHLFHDNARALRLYQKLGFVVEGVLRGHATRRGDSVDVLAMGLLREEWLRSQA